MGSPLGSPSKPVFPCLIGGPPFIPIRTCLGAGAGGGCYNQNPPLCLKLSLGLHCLHAIGMRVSVAMPCQQLSGEQQPVGESSAENNGSNIAHGNAASNFE